MNIDQFELMAFPIVNAAIDSVRILAYLQIPYFALQFVKIGKQFQAGYEANIVIQDMKGNQIKHTFWKDSVQVHNYLQTTSRSSFATLRVECTALKQSYNIQGEVIDLDTKNSGIKSKKLDVDINQGELYLYPPLILLKREGEWGFETDEFPALKNNIENIDEDIQLFVSGRVNPGDFTLKFILKGKNRDTLWDYEQTLSAPDSTFTYRVKVPRSAFDAIKLNLEVQLIQSEREKSEAIEILVQKPGISHLVNDINEALEQMRYILTNEENTALKSANRGEREELYRTFWKDRDPTPSSVYNELMEEYYHRVRYSNEHFTGFQPGWRSDMGMIYILLGPPDDVERVTMPRKQNTYETWYYYRINQSFVFEDENGFGEYRLKTPFFGTSSIW